MADGDGHTVSVSGSRLTRLNLKRSSHLKGRVVDMVHPTTPSFNRRLSLENLQLKLRAMHSSIQLPVFRCTEIQSSRIQVYFAPISNLCCPFPTSLHGCCREEASTSEDRVKKNEGDPRQPFQCRVRPPFRAFRIFIPTADNFGFLDHSRSGVLDRAAQQHRYESLPVSVDSSHFISCRPTHS